MSRGFRRVAWTFGDQSLSSLTNAALTVVVARNVATEDFGTFALLMGGYLLALFVSRGMTSDPFVSLHSGADPSRLTRSGADSAGAALLGGIGLAVLLLFLASFVSDGVVVAAFAISIPGVFLQDHVRYLNFAVGEPQRAFMIDGIWAIAQLAAIWIVVASRPGNLGLLILGWGVAGTLSATAGLLLLRLRPNVFGGRAWLRSAHSLWRHYTIENLLLQVTNLLVLAGVAVISGVDAAGALRGAVTMYTPLTLFAAGAIAAGVPELARLGRRKPARVAPLSICVGVVLATVALGWMLVVNAIPTGLGEEILGATWADAAPLLVLVGIDQVAAQFVLGPFMGMRAMGRTQGMATRGWMSLVRVVASLVGAWRGGVYGAAVGFVVLAPAQVMVWTVTLLRAPRAAPQIADDGGIS